MNSILIRKLKSGYGVFKLTEVNLVKTIPDIESLCGLVQELCKREEDWPSVGKPYWFISMPNPLNISINQGVITENLMKEIKDCEDNKYGNMFQTKKQAVETAKNLMSFFE